MQVLKNGCLKGMIMQKDAVRFAELMAVLAEVYDDGRPPNKIKTEIYFQALKQYDISTLQQAIEHIIKTRVFPSFPKPGEIVQEIESAKGDLALLAWTQVVTAIKRIGPWKSVRFGDPTIHAVVEFMGGWPAAGDWRDDELKWKQKEFERLYGVMKIRGEAVKYLPGLFEISNEANGYPGLDKPIAIGVDDGKKQIEGTRM